MPTPWPRTGRTSSAINLNGVFNVTQAFLEQMRKTKGRIVNIGSMQSFVHIRTPSSAAYTASKHGVLGFTKALAAELGKDGVRVNAIGPGFIETPLNAQTRANHPEHVKVFMDHTPLGRAGTAGRHRRARRYSSRPICQLTSPARSSWRTAATGRCEQAEHPMPKRVSVIGAGTIGASWAACFLARGFEVVGLRPLAQRRSLRAPLHRQCLADAGETGDRAARRRPRALHVFQ